MSIILETSHHCKVLQYTDVPFSNDEVPEIHVVIKEFFPVPVPVIGVRLRFNLPQNKEKYRR